MSWLDRFVASAFPDAQVYRRPHDDKYEVRLLVSPVDLAADREHALRKVHRALTPQFKRYRRKLWWGRKH